MTDFILALLLLLLAVAVVSIRKTYSSLPLVELKRRTEKHDSQAAKLYAAAAYGTSLRVLLLLWIAAASAAGCVLLARSAPTWLSILAVTALLLVVFAWLPNGRLSAVSWRLTFFVTPGIVWVLSHLHPLLSKSERLIEKRHSEPHTNLFEKNDLIGLIEQQQRQADSRFTDEELGIAKRALQFGDHKVVNVLTPRSHVKTVLADDTVGPVLIDELHKAKQTYALVRETAKGPFAGTLAFGKLGLKSHGKVRDTMDGAVYYLHEDDPLSEALHAFFVTNHSLFVVVNSFEEYSGIITIGDVLGQLLGHLPGDDFDQYSDLSAVAGRYAADHHHKHAEKPVQTEDKVVE